MSRRLQRLNGLIRQDLAELIQTELRDPRLASLISITRVDVSPDLENAIVHVSVLGEPDEKKKSLQGLTAASQFLRHHLLERLRLRKIPHLHFELDESIAEAAHVLELMRQVADKEGRSAP